MTHRWRATGFRELFVADALIVYVDTKYGLELSGSK
jgi:hypothetical protein